MSFSQHCKTGVLVCDVPEPRKNTAHVMLLHNLLAYTLANPRNETPSSVIVVSNAAGFAPTIHKLTQSYPVHVIAHLSHCSEKRRCATPHVIDWEQLCKSKLPIVGAMSTASTALAEQWEIVQKSNGRGQGLRQHHHHQT
jgi:hypothetical protein